MPPPLTTKIPSITLDTEFVTDSMAARLCITLVGHVLFLKSQVPFPVMQLARMPMPSGETTSSRATKKRLELLNSFDTLASHLNTTFTALSTAFALRSGTPRKGKATGGRAYLAIVLGPTPGSAKSRVIVGVDALEARVWGERGDDCLRVASECPDQESADKYEARNNSEDDSLSDDDSDADSNENNDNGDGDSQKGETGSEMEFNGPSSTSTSSSQALSPPPSRTPSPSHSPPPSPSPSPTPPPTYAQELEALRTAERLLSRTLASACGENEGHGMATEMPPTQTHIVLRAPRRFMHPAWVPKQALTAAFDVLLDEFLEASDQSPNPSPSLNPNPNPSSSSSSGLSRTDDVKKKKKMKRGVEGVWIRSRRGTAIEEHEQEQEMDGDVAEEEDEMIWWTWDGKLVGFADW